MSRVIERFITFYCYFVMLDSVCQFNEGAVLNKRLFYKDNATITEASDMWQPIIQLHYRSPKPTTFAPTLLTTTTEYLHRWHSKNNLSKKANENHHYTLNSTGYSGKHLAKPILTTQPLSPTPAESYLQLKVHTYPLNKHNSTTANTKEHQNHQFNSYRQHLLSVSYNTLETQYPQIQISKNVMHPPTPHQGVNKNSSTSTHFNSSKNFVDTLTHKDLANSSSSSVNFWYNLAPAQHVATTSTTDNKENILATSFSALLADEDFNDNREKRGFQNRPENNSDIKSLKLDDKKVVNATEIATSDKSHYDSEKKFLEKLLSNSKDFDKRIKHKISNNNNEISSRYGDDEQIGSAVHLIEDTTYDNNDPAMLTTTSQQLIKATSKSLSAAIAASLKMLHSFDMKSIISAASTTATSFLSFLQKATETEDETRLDKIPSTATNGADIIAQVRNVSNKHETPSSAATATTKITTPTLSLSAEPTSKSSTAFSSGRKLKKVKKKFQQFLLPLLLAYKLKFLALMPLLAGGLVLLVGSTGLAGFFFALFTAVISLKTDQGKAFLVKQYK